MLKPAAKTRAVVVLVTRGNRAADVHALNRGQLAPASEKLVPAA